MALVTRKTQAALSKEQTGTDIYNVDNFLQIVCPDLLKEMENSGVPTDPKVC